MGWRLIKKPDFGGLKRRIGEQELKFANYITNEARLAHMKIVANWDEPPIFELDVKHEKYGIRSFIFVRDTEGGRHWHWANNGTGIYAGNPEYDIVPNKPGGVLSFNLGYTPKTTRTSYGGPGEATGPRVFTTKVHRRGNVDRRYDQQVFKMIVKKHGKKFVKFLAKVLRR